MMALVPRSQRAVETLYEVDPEFSDFVTMVYGGVVDPEEIWKDAFGPIRKDNPTQSDLDTSANPNNGKRRLAIAGTVLGAGIGVKEMGVGGRDLYRAARGGGTGLLKPTGKVLASGGMLAADVAATDELRRHASPQKIGKRRRVRKSDAGLGELVEGAVRQRLVVTHGIGGEEIVGGLAPKGARVQQAAGQLGRDTKAGYGSTRTGAPADVGNGPATAGTPQPAAPPTGAAPPPTPGGTAGAASGTAVPGAAAGGGGSGAIPGVNTGGLGYQVGAVGGNVVNAALTPTGKKIVAATGALGLAHHLMHGHDQQQTVIDPYGQYQVGKRGDVVWEGTISKVDDDKHLAFGFASVVSIGGTPVLDRQGDVISQDEIEKAAYDYVIKSRKGGDMHRRTTDEFGQDAPHHVSDLVESFVITDEKVEKMGLPDDTPRGWWVGFKIHDEPTWQLVKKGERTGFSIHGRGRRVDAGMDELMGYRV